VLVSGAESLRPRASRRDGLNLLTCRDGRSREGGFREHQSGLFNLPVPEDVQAHALRVLTAELPAARLMRARADWSRR
jgi:hypothetical protein